MICPRCGGDNATYVLSVCFESMTDYGMSLRKKFNMCPKCYRELIEDATKAMRGKDADSDTRVQ